MERHITVIINRLVGQNAPIRLPLRCSRFEIGRLQILNHTFGLIH